jgi:glycosyltransferase involved in cell wall biosynthesis
MSPRLAYVCADPGVPVYGRKGCSIHVQEVVRGLTRAGAAVELFCARVGGAAPPDLRDLPVHDLGCPPAPDAHTRAGALLDANAALDQRLCAAGPFDAVYERHALFSFAAMEHARRRGVPGLLEVNAPLIQEQDRYRGLVRAEEAEAAASRALRAASALLAVSEPLAGWLRQQPGPGGRVHVLPNGVDTGRFRPDAAPALPRPPGSFTLGFVGSLKAWHGLEDLIPVLEGLRRAVPAARLLIVGEGPMRARLEEQAAALRCADAVTFTGGVDPDCVPSLLTSMDATLAPYPPMDRFYFSPLKVFEYMAAGRAVVAAATGQIADVIEDGVTGLLHPPGDAAALEAALRRLAADEPLRRRLGAAARRRAVAQHGWDRAVGAILHLVRSTRAGLVGGAA